MFCGNCGKQLSDTASFCPACGTPVEKEQEKTQNVETTPIVEASPEAAPTPEPVAAEAPKPEPTPEPTPEPAPAPTPTPAPTPAPAPAPYASAPKPNQGMTIPIRNYDPRWDYTPLGAWSYFLYNLLFSIPLVGWIIALVFAVGGTNRINLRNYARSYFCILFIAAVLAVIIIAIVFGVVGTEAFRHSSHYYM